MNGTALVTPELPYQDAAGAKNSTATAAGSIAAAVVATAVGVLSLFFIRKRRKSARGIPAGFVRHNAAQIDPSRPTEIFPNASSGLFAIFRGVEGDENTLAGTVQLGGKKNTTPSTFY